MLPEPPPVILIVDDAPENLMVLNELLRPQYKVLASTNGDGCLRVAQGPVRPDLILLDVMMPDMDGYEVLARLRNDPLTAAIPVIFLTALATIGDEERGLQLGAADYITKPITPAIVLARVRTQLQVKQAADLLKNQNIYLEQEVARRMSENDLALQASIRALARLAEVRVQQCDRHILRTQAYVQHLARALHRHPRFASLLSKQYIDLLGRSVPLHDIGKAGIPDSVLNEPGELSAEARAIMQTHTRIGSEAIERAASSVGVSLDFLSLAREITRWHHEKWDGSGYPDQLSGDSIPVSARLMALADVFDALISARPYRAAWSFTEARAIIREQRGVHFDPDIVDAFLADFAAYTAIAERYPDADVRTEANHEHPDRFSAAART